MSKTEIPKAAIDRNKAWIEAVTKSLGERKDIDLLKTTMKDAGKKCADQLLEMTINHFGRDPKSVDELIAAINKRRRDVLKAKTFWVRDGNKAQFTEKSLVRWVNWRGCLNRPSILRFPRRSFFKITLPFLSK